MEAFNTTFMSYCDLNVSLHNTYNIKTSQISHVNIHQHLLLQLHTNTLYSLMNNVLCVCLGTSILFSVTDLFIMKMTVCLCRVKSFLVCVFGLFSVLVPILIIDMRPTPFHLSGTTIDLLLHRVNTFGQRN